MMGEGQQDKAQPTEEGLASEVPPEGETNNCKEPVAASRKKGASANPSEPTMAGNHDTGARGDADAMQTT